MKNLTFILAASLLTLPAFAAPAPAVRAPVKSAPATAPRPAVRAPIGTAPQIGARGTVVTPNNVKIGSAAAGVQQQGNALTPAARGAVQAAPTAQQKVNVTPEQGKDIFGQSCSIQAKAAIPQDVQAVVLASKDVSGITCSESMSPAALAVLKKSIVAAGKVTGGQAKVDAIAKEIQTARPGISNAEANQAVKGVFCQTPGHSPCAAATAASGICQALASVN